MRCGVHGRIADGIRALSRSVRTVGCFTDGHGRAALTACFRLDPGRRAERASRVAARRPARLPGTRAAGTGPVTGGRPFPRRAIPGRPPGSQDQGDIRGHRRARRVSERLTVAERPPGRLSPNVIDTTGPALPSPRCRLRALPGIKLSGALGAHISQFWLIPQVCMLAHMYQLRSFTPSGCYRRAEGRFRRRRRDHRQV